MKTMLSLVLFLAASLAISQGYAQPKPTADDAKQLKALEAAYVKSKAAYTKHPGASSKRAYVESTVRFGTATMTTNVLDRKVKYRKALQLYREALKLDPKNEEARNNSQLIADIYRSMGLPVPK